MESSELSDEAALEAASGKNEEKPKRRSTRKKAVPAPPLILPPAPHVEECSAEWQQFYVAVRDAVKKLG
ncbi:hypothetical protein D3C72_2461100 [compost metagenome]